MVPALLYLLMKKYVIKYWPAVRRKMSQVLLPKNFLLMVGFLILMLLKLVSLKAQEKELQYNIIRNGKVIGWTKLSRVITNDQVDIRMKSEVKARFIFQFLVSAIEEATFQAGNLIYSSQYRKLNEDVKEDKWMKLTCTGYEVYKGHDTQRLNFPPLHNHTLSLYYEEPKQDSKVYSDSFQRELAVERLSDGGYRIKLPDGNSCSYYYRNGICTKVKINQTFYSAEMVLNQ